MSVNALVAPLMRRRTAAALLGVSATTVDRLAKAGKLPSVRVGGSVRYALPDLESFIARQRREGAANELTKVQT